MHARTPWPFPSAQRTWWSGEVARLHIYASEQGFEDGTVAGSSPRSPAVVMETMVMYSVVESMLRGDDDRDKKIKKIKSYA